MAKRAKVEEERSMDSLLDAMTNVVGILLLILTVVSLGITTEVKKMIENMPDISQEELEDMRESHKKTLANLEDIRTTRDDVVKNTITPEQEVQLAADLKKFEEENSDLATLADTIASWKQKVDAVKPVEAEKQERNKAELKRLRELEAILANKDPIIQPEPHELKMPNPRSAKGKTKVYYVAVKHNKVYSIGEPYAMVERIGLDLDRDYEKVAYDAGELGDYSFTLKTPKTYLNDKKERKILEYKVDFSAKSPRIQEQLDYMKPPIFKWWSFKDGKDISESKPVFEWIFGKTEEQIESKREWNLVKLRLDKKKLENYFKENYQGKNDVNYHQTIANDQVFIHVTVNPEKGVPIDQLRQPTTEFATLVKEAASAQNRVNSLIKYYVAPDSFETYLAAREITEAVKLDASWEIWNSAKLEKDQLRPVLELEKWVYDLTKLPAEGYSKTSKTAGPLLVDNATKAANDFKSLPGNLKVPEDNLGYESPEAYKTALSKKREGWIKGFRWHVENLYKSPWTALESDGASDAKASIRIEQGVQPPKLLFTRVFNPSNPPMAPDSKKNETKKKDGEDKPPKPGFTLD